MQGVRFLVATDHDVLRRGVRSILEKNPNWKIVAEARDGREAIEKAKAFEPDIAILDFSMPEVNGLEATREIIKNPPHPKVLILAIHDNEALLQEMRRAGARGYVLKSGSERDLVSGINALVANKDFYPAVSTASLHRPVKSDRGKPRARLTNRQKEIVTLLAQGLRNEKIAQTLGISVRTVETHRQHILRRTNCQSTADLVRYAIRNGIIEA